MIPSDCTDKWVYMRAIGSEDKLLELLEQTGHRSTLAVTLEEARNFYKRMGGTGCGCSDRAG